MDLLVPNFIKYQLYLLQLENYELGRYWKLLWQRGFFPSKAKPQRKELVWTTKAKALMFMAGGLHALLVVVAIAVTSKFYLNIDVLFSVLLGTALILLPFYFVLFSVALFIISPLDHQAKDKLIKQAQIKLSSLQNVKVVGVAGSYGKTTMKEVLNQVLGVRFKVLSTPESVNTPVGIARFIIDKLSPEIQILIIELGEHYSGDIKELCNIIQPDISVITGINEAHLERMGTLDNVASTIFEAAEFSKSDAMVLMNGDDKNILNNFKKYTGLREVRFYSSGNGQSDYLVANKKFDVDGLVWNFEVTKHGNFSTPLLGEYAVGMAVGALAAGKYLGMSSEQVRAGLVSVKPIEHRLHPIKSGGGVLVIDDSYNGNPDGAREAINLLAKFKDKRKIYLTPGLVETGSATKEVHRKIGEELAAVADIVILIKDSVTPFIEQGIKAAAPTHAVNSPVVLGREVLPVQVAAIPKILWFDTAIDAHESLKNIIQPGDVILFQNDWGDQYV